MAGKITRLLIFATPLFGIFMLTYPQDPRPDKTMPLSTALKVDGTV
jgi:hypothetical protein